MSAAEEDSFDIDIYGDGGEDYQEEGQLQEAAQSSEEQPETTETTNEPDANENCQDQAQEQADTSNANAESQKIGSTDDSSHEALLVPKQAPQIQGRKRKEGNDDRPTDPGATAALFVSDLHWWITDDDIRGWANQSECEDELQEVTFSEHKVNGKSKGYSRAFDSLWLDALLMRLLRILADKLTFYSHLPKLQRRQSTR